MSDGTKIEWTEATWNPITGCSVTSPGCTNCYAMKLAGTRLRHHESRAGLTVDSKAGPVWTGETRFNEQWIDQPLRWKRPRMIFVCAHGDLFHESVPDAWIDRVFAVMALCPQHTFQVLTKRSTRMREWTAEHGNFEGRCVQNLIETALGEQYNEFMGDWMCVEAHTPKSATTIAEAARAAVEHQTLPNVWLGVSVEDQARADERIPDLLATPAAVRWLSCEPLLGPVDLDCPDIDWCAYPAGNGLEAMPPKGRGRLLFDWIVAGGESGPGARPMHPDWARSLRDQCAAAGVPFFFKQWGDWIPDAETCPDFPEDDAEQSRFDTCVWDSDAGRFDMTNGSWMDSDQWFFASDYSEPEQPLTRIGKRRAGRLLDGVQHDAMPAVSA